MTMRPHAVLVTLYMLSMSGLPASAQTAPEVARSAFAGDVHARAGLTCVACHTAATAARSETYRIQRTAVAQLCAGCHSDITYMRRFAPQVRVDQYQEYLTSTHGKRMASGESRVATCSDCHGAHGIIQVKDARSPVAPVRIAHTCARCHADATLMTAFGRPTTIVADWSASVHAAALLTRGDLSAPTCSTCHGSHGATPPGTSSVANVCAQCHVREGELFAASPKKPVFEAMGQKDCLACHGNHRIVHPQDSWIGLKEPAVCATCHDETTGGAATIAAVRQGLDGLTARMESARVLLDRAERAGMLVDEGRAALREANEHAIHSRVLVHAFATRPFEQMAAEAVASAGRAQRVGAEAMRELQYRRRGLGIATVLILGFLATLGLKIRDVARRSGRS